MPEMHRGDRHPFPRDLDCFVGRRRFQSPRSLQAMIPIIALGTEAQDVSFILDPEARVIGARGRSWTNNISPQTGPLGPCTL